LIHLGIDLGLDGAIARVEHRGTTAIEDIPTFALRSKGMVKRAIAPVELMAVLRRLVEPGEKAIAIVEEVHTFPSGKNSPQSGGSLMETKGCVRAVLALAGIEAHWVDPQTWKALYGLNASKDASLEIARTLYPEVQQLLTRKRDHNRAESLLLAHWGLRKLA
jgi:hypothetical protein